MMKQNKINLYCHFCGAQFCNEPEIFIDAYEDNFNMEVNNKNVLDKRLD